MVLRKPLRDYLDPRHRDRQDAPCRTHEDHDIQLSKYFQCTVTLTDAVLLARLGSGVSAMVAAFAVMTVPDGAVTFTVSRTVQVLFRAMLPCS